MNKLTLNNVHIEKHLYAALEQLKNAVKAILDNHNMLGGDMSWLDSDDAYGDWYSIEAVNSPDFTNNEKIILKAYNNLLWNEAFGHFQNE